MMQDYRLFLSLIILSVFWSPASAKLDIVPKVVIEARILSSVRDEQTCYDLNIQFLNRDAPVHLFNPYLDPFMPMPVELMWRKKGGEWQPWDNGLTTGSRVWTANWIELPSGGVAGKYQDITQRVNSWQKGQYEVRVTMLRMLFEPKDSKLLTGNPVAPRTEPLTEQEKAHRRTLHDPVGEAAIIEFEKL